MSTFTRLDGVATIFGLGSEDFGRMHELSEVQFGPDRMQATACEPLRLGMRVAMGFQAREALARSGSIERCDAVEKGYRVVIRFDKSIAS